LKGKVALGGRGPLRKGTAREGFGMGGFLVEGGVLFGLKMKNLTVQQKTYTEEE